MDTMSGRLLIVGGGHGDYNGNEVYALYPPGATLPEGVTCTSATAPALCRIKEPSASLRSLSGSCFSTAGDGVTMNSRHTYDGMAFIGPSNTLFIQGGSLACATGNHFGDTWTLDLASLAWAAKDPVTASGTKPRDICSGCGNQGQGPWTSAIYDAQRNMVITQTALYPLQSGAVLWSYDLATNKYTTRATDALLSKYGSWVIDPVRHRLYIIGPDDGPGSGNATTSLGTPRISYIDISAGGAFASTVVNLSGAGCDGLAAAPAPGVDYDPVLDRIVGWPNFGDTVYLFDPATGACASQTFSGGPPDSRDASNSVSTTGTFGRFRYLLSSNAYLLVNEASQNAFMLRLSPLVSSSGTGMAFRGSMRMK